MSVTITGPHYLIKPVLPNGAANPLFGLAAYLAIRATGRDNQINVDVVGDVATVEGITDVSAIELSTLEALVGEGAEVTGYPVWIAIPEADATDEVPAYLPNRLDENDVARTWATWHDASHEAATIDGVVYVPGNAFGEELAGSVIAQLIAGGFNVLTLDQRRAIVETPPE